jgi:hypothetical protein
MAGRRLQNPEITIPRAKPVDPKKSRANAKFKELMRDKGLLHQVREEAKKSVFWDGNSGKSARENRKRIRDLFEEYVESEYWDGGRSYRGPSFQASYFEPVLMQAEPGEMPIAKIWDVEMFTARCKELMHILCVSSQGRVGPRPKATVLWHAKNALYWWCIRFNPYDTSHIIGSWHSDVSAQIQRLSLLFSLASGSWQRNNLGEEELRMFYDIIMSKESGTAFFL